MDILEAPTPSKRVAFRWESEMIEPVLNARRDFTNGVFEDGPVDARLEVPTAAGVPDIVFVSWDEDVVVHREKHFLGPVLEMTKVRVLDHLNHGRTTLGDLSRAAGVSRAHLQRSIMPQLTDAGWLTINDDRSVELRDGATYFAPVRSLVTVETKLRDWRRALHQAYGHAQGADGSFIALDVTHAAPGLRYAEDFAALGVGLATVDAATGAVHVVSKPSTPRTRRRSAGFLLAAERVWDLRLRGLDSGEVGHVFGRDLHVARGTG